jgi:hypothetical protein
MPPEDVRGAVSEASYILCWTIGFSVTAVASSRLHVRWSWTGAGAVAPYLVLYVASLVTTFGRGRPRLIAICMVGLALGWCICLVIVDRGRAGLYIIGLAIFAAWWFVAGALLSLRHDK